MGEVDSIYWFLNGQLLSVNNTSKLVADNRTLCFSPVQHSDEGVYYCQAFNYVSNMTSSSYTLRLNCKYVHHVSIALWVLLINLATLSQAR